MAVFHQMGHASQNLLYEDELLDYAGAIQSPINYSEEQCRNQIQSPPHDDFKFIFDPQLYYPSTQRSILTEWSYFPSDVETADTSSLSWWRHVVNDLAISVNRFNPTAVCSPAIVPRTYSLDYYHLCYKVREHLEDALAEYDIGVLQTLLVKLEHIADPNVIHEIASLLTSGYLNRVYLVFICNLRPRLERCDENELSSAMDLIQLLETSGIHVLVGFSSSDIVLWKSSGASDCATGKYFNLRRFTPSRWTPPIEGGGQLSYWFEESLMAFLREGDLLRVSGVLPEITNNVQNPYGVRIINQIESNPGQAWIALGWRQYLYWFKDIEHRLQNDELNVDQILQSAEHNWDVLERANILMEERTNNGNWLRHWRLALSNRTY